MGKRAAILVLIFLVGCVTIIGFSLRQKRKNLVTDPYKSVSPAAGIVIETHDFQSFINSLTTGKGLFGEAQNVKEFDTFNRKLKYLAIQANTSGFRNLFENSTSVISFQTDSKGDLQMLISLAVPWAIRYRQLNEILHTSGIKVVIKERINSYTILKLPYNIDNHKDTAYISIKSGLVLISGSEELILGSIYQTTRDTDVRSNPGFSNVLMASGKNEDKLFVVFGNLSGMLRSYLGGKGLRFEEKIGNLAGSAGGDIFINDDGIVLSGYTESTDSSEYLYRYKYLPPREFHTYEILPSSTVLFETLVLAEGMFIRNSSDNVSKEAEALSLKLKGFIKSEITKAMIDIKGSPFDDNFLIIYELDNRVMAEMLFIEELDSNSEILYFKPDDQVNIPVYKTSFKGFIESVLPGFAPESDEVYFAFYDNYMVSGRSYSTVTKLLYDNLLNKTLANDLIYRDFESTLPSRAGYFFFCVPERIADYIGGFLSDNIRKTLNSNRNSLSKIQAAGYQSASSNGMLYNSISIRYKEEVREESKTDWETLLDTTASIKPFFFTNHLSGAKEIFIQDMKNNIYLINAAGRVLWKVNLNERIIGTVYMIDFYRNGKFQLLFSGRNYFHLIDRNGNYVERYPVKLRSPATNSLSLFDYDNNRDYRLFIAGEDKNVYSYDKSGSVVKGWKTFRTAGHVRGEVSYFKVSGKDYIVVSDDNSLYFLDRTGNIRVNLKEIVKKAAGSALRLNPGSPASVLCTSTDGTVQNIYFDGSIKKTSLRKFSDDHSFDFFDVDGDGIGEYVFIENGILYLYDRNKKELFSRDFETSLLGGPINFIFSQSDRKIGVFDRNKNLIYLIGKDGETMSGFPLRGASMFSIGKLSDKSGWHLIVGGTNRFLYNYKIENDLK